MKRYRSALLLLFVGFLAAAGASAAGTNVVHVWTSYRQADSFDTIGELFGRGETTRGRVVARSQPERREGFYFLVRLRAEAPIERATAQLELIMPGAPKITRREFPISLPAGKPVMHLGVTGADWPDPKARPVAWRITLRGASGETLVQEQSFLWAQGPS